MGGVLQEGPYPFPPCPHLSGSGRCGSRAFSSCERWRNLSFLKREGAGGSCSRCSPSAAAWGVCSPRRSPRISGHGSSLCLPGSPRSKMPALLVGSRMKSGLPKAKPVHSAPPIPQTHTRPAPALPAAPLKSQQACPRPPRSSAAGSEAGGSTQVRLHPPLKPFPQLFLPSN